MIEDSDKIVGKEVALINQGKGFCKSTMKKLATKSMVGNKLCPTRSCPSEVLSGKLNPQSSFQLSTITTKPNQLFTNWTSQPISN